jgi:hypothetical protein
MWCGLLSTTDRCAFRRVWDGEKRGLGGGGRNGRHYMVVREGLGLKLLGGSITRLFVLQKVSLYFIILDYLKYFVLEYCVLIVQMVFVKCFSVDVISFEGVHVCTFLLEF